MLDTIRHLMPYGHLQITVKDKQWLLTMIVLDQSRIPAHSVYVWSKNLEEGLSELLKKTKEEYSKMLDGVKAQKENAKLFED